MRCVGPDNMIEGQQVRVAECLRRLRIVPDRDRVRGNLSLWKDDANTHVLPSSVRIGPAPFRSSANPWQPPHLIHDTYAYMCHGRGTTASSGHSIGALNARWHGACSTCAARPSGPATAVAGLPLIRPTRLRQH